MLSWITTLPFIAPSWQYIKRITRTCINIIYYEALYSFFCFIFQMFSFGIASMMKNEIVWLYLLSSLNLTILFHFNLFFFILFSDSSLFPLRLAMSLIHETREQLSGDFLLHHYMSFFIQFLLCTFVSFIYLFLFITTFIYFFLTFSLEKRNFWRG